MARALLEQETIDGSEVGRLVNDAFGQPVHVTGAKVVPAFNGNGKTGRDNGAASTNGGVGGSEHTPGPLGAPSSAAEAAASTLPGRRAGDGMGWAAERTARPAHLGSTGHLATAALARDGSSSAVAQPRIGQPPSPYPRLLRADAWSHAARCPT